jgi:hypothetical protein
MSISANAQIEFEAGQTLHTFHALSDSGDHVTLTSPHAPWSRCAGFAPTIAPDGVKNGGTITPATSATNDKVDVAQLLVSLAGVDVPVATEADVTVSRGLTTDTHRITSITVTSLGAIAAVAGVDGTAFSETRGADGGPPFIPVGSVEVGQVRTTSVTAAPILATEILQIHGQHMERAAFPSYEVKALDGAVVMAAPLPLSHTGGVAKTVYAKVYTPVFQAAARTLDFVPIERSFSSTSQEYYGGSTGGQSESMGQGKFTALLDDGHTDSLIGQAGKNLLFRFRQDRNRLPYSLTQGTLGIARTYPKSSQVQAQCTITGQEPTKDFEG